MTDLERLEAIFEDFGLTIKREDNALVLEGDNQNPKQGGYYGFFAHFQFTENGQFITMGVWE